jgi:hypothetical protein
MPALSNPKHEAFAIALFKGLSQRAAYEQAGYTHNDGNATRLKNNEKVQTRIAELQAEAAKKAIEQVSFDARDMFMRLEAQIIEAAAAGDHKTAMDGRRFMLSCFGFEDSPTLTHEQVAGKKLGSEPPAEERQAAVHLVPNRRFEKLMTKLARARG